MPKALVRKRCFVQMTGYEPVGAEHQHRRFIREMARFQKAWNVEGKVSPPSLSADGAVANWTIETWGPNWRVVTEFHHFRWDDFVAADMAGQRLVAVSARHGRAFRIHSDRHGDSVFHRGMALWRLFSLSARFHLRHGVARRFRRRGLPSSISACLTACWSRRYCGSRFSLRCAGPSAAWCTSLCAR